MPEFQFENVRGIFPNRLYSDMARKAIDAILKKHGKQTGKKCDVSHKIKAV